MHLDQLRALLAVVDHGTFDAAGALHITPSAVSQRIKGLERATGRVLVERATPCRATAPGETLVRAARQMVALEEDVLQALGEGGGPAADLPGCRCGAVIRGVCAPQNCPLFGKACTPADPVGPCMVSGEGACAAAYKYVQ